MRINLVQNQLIIEFQVPVEPSHLVRIECFHQPTL